MSWSNHTATKSLLLDATSVSSRKPTAATPRASSAAEGDSGSPRRRVKVTAKSTSQTTALKLDEETKSEPHVSVTRGVRMKFAELALQLFIISTNWLVITGQLNNACTVDTDCASVASAICQKVSPSCNAGACRCAAGYREIRNTCKKVVPLGEACQATDICAGEHMTCDRGVCRCDFGYKGPGPRANDCIPNLARARLGGLCYDDSACYYSLYCAANKCTCRPGSKPVEPGNFDCTEKVPGDSCKQSYDCRHVANAACDKGVCRCVSGYKAHVFYADNSTRPQHACILDYEKPSKLGEMCSYKPGDAFNQLCDTGLRCITCPESIQPHCVEFWPELRVTGAGSKVTPSSFVTLSFFIAMTSLVTMMGRARVHKPSPARI